jgi:hypothetical protein
MTLEAMGVRVGGTRTAGWSVAAVDPPRLGQRLTAVVSGLGGDRPGDQAYDGGKDRGGEDEVEDDGCGHGGSFFVVWLTIYGAQRPPTDFSGLEGR